MARNTQGHDPAIALLPSFTLACFLLIICVLTLTFPEKQWARFIRFSLGPFALWGFWDFGFGYYSDHGPSLTPTLYATITPHAVYGIMRVIETCLLLGDAPPRWISLHTGKQMPLPHDLAGRVVYTMDLFGTMCGRSWMSDRRWDFASPRISRYQTSQSRTSFVLHGVASVALGFIAIDIVDTCVKAIPFDRTSFNPVTGALSAPLQIFCTLLLGVWTYTTLVVNHSFISTFCVAFGLTSAAVWPPMFDSPFLASSVQDFWSNRWHHQLRPCFTRFATSILSPFAGDDSKVHEGMLRVAKVALVFTMSTLLHVIVVCRPPQDPSLVRRDCRNWPTVAFFLGQPAGIAIDADLAYLGLGSSWRRVFAWVWFLWTGRWWGDAYVKTGIWSDKHVPWSPVRGILFGNWWP